MVEDKKSRSTKSFQRLKKLVSLMNENSLVELELEDEEFRVRLVKSNPGSAMQQVMVPAAPAQAVPVEPAKTEKTVAPEEDESLHAIKSPIVGTFYRAPAPDAPEYVDTGDKVTKDKVVCIIEAMKVMNELKAEVNGTIVKVLVENAQTVEYGQPLFLVKPD